MKDKETTTDNSKKINRSRFIDHIDRGTNVVARDADENQIKIVKICRGKN